VIVLFIVGLYICVCECLLQYNNHKIKHQNNTTAKQLSFVQGPVWECRSIRSGASGLPYYCAPLVCVSAVIELLAVWRYNKPKTKNDKKKEKDLVFSRHRVIQPGSLFYVIQPGSLSCIGLSSFFRLLPCYFCL